MATLIERIETSLPIDRAFAFVADFANAERWDPGVASSARVGPATGRPAEGTSYRLGIRMAGRVAPMTYTVTRWDPPNQVVLTGSGSGVDAVDDIRFSATANGTRIDYTADIRLRGLLRLLSPFTGAAFATIARNAREGMQRALDTIAAQATGGPDGDDAGSDQ
jgi:carbon monoxide dehydrogenase subunit G